MADTAAAGPDPLPEPARPASARSTLQVIGEVLAGVATVVAGLLVTARVAAATGSSVLAGIAGAAVFAPVLVWMIRRGRRAAFLGLRTMAFALPLMVVAAVLIQTYLERRARGSARPPRNVLVPSTFPRPR